MLYAFFRLGFITLATAILIVFAVVFVRWMGFQQAFAPPPHAWFERLEWNVRAPPDICLNKEQGAILQATVHFRDGDWWANCEKPTTLDQLLKDSAQRDWLLIVKANDSTHLDKLVEIVGSHDAKKKFGIASDSQRASRFLRKKGPQWLFAADPSTLLRLQIFSSLWIETAMDFWPDFVLAGSEPNSPSHLSPRVAEELIRRQKKIIWTSDENPLIPVSGRYVR